MSLQQQLSSLGLSPLVVAKLLEADFVTVADISNLQPSELSNATKLSLKESAEVMRLSHGGTTKLTSKSVKDILIAEEDVSHIVTFCQSLDELLGGGIPLGAMTEVAGTPGIGKTQLCLQLCVSVQIPKDAGGLAGKAFYIDTEGSFSVLRLNEIATFTAEHINKVYELKDFTTETILKGIHYVRCHSNLELLAISKCLPAFLSSHSGIRLIVIDSVAFHLRHELSDAASRTSALCSLTQQLIQQATKHRLAVVVSNQMTTKIHAGGGHLVPALGEAWAHCPTLRLLLLWENGVRTARLMKAPHLPCSEANFQITAGGIRDLKSSSTSRKRKLESHSD